MKKLVLTLSIVSLFLSCTEKQDYLKLPETEKTQYISGKTVTFPKGTTALQIYDTVKYLSPDNNILTVTNGNINDNKGTLNFDKIIYDDNKDKTRYNYIVNFYNSSNFIIQYYTNYGYNNDQINAITVVTNSKISFQY
jgi:hypothetical protein